MGGTILYHMAIEGFSSLRGKKYASKPHTRPKMKITIAIFMIFFDFNGCPFQTLMFAMLNSYYMPYMFSDEHTKRQPDLLSQIHNYEIQIKPVQIKSKNRGKRK
jgi:hypothetical protein